MHQSCDEGEKNVSSRMSVGTLALHTGLWPSPVIPPPTSSAPRTERKPSLKAYGEFIRIVDKDHDQASLAIQGAFIKACEKAGIPFQESIGP